ncbi:hypothetical protein JCM3765_001937 [Sporobolomyces pararoseus]
MTSSTSEQPLGECVVCGKLCSKGCSSCKKVGLDWMYFCSVDHQRLIWRVHKHVCGKNPFEWPPLSADEAKEAWNLRNQQVFSSSAETWIERILSRYHSRAPHLRLDLVKPGTEAADMVFETLLEAVQRPTPKEILDGIVGRHRSQQFCVKFKKLKGPEEILRAAVEDPFGLMASRHHPLGSRFSSTFEHRFAILVSVLVVDVQDHHERGIGSGCTKKDYLEHTKSALLALSGQEMRSTDDQTKVDKVAEKVVGSTCQVLGFLH